MNDAVLCLQRELANQTYDVMIHFSKSLEGDGKLLGRYM